MGFINKHRKMILLGVGFVTPLLLIFNNCQNFDAMTVGADFGSFNLASTKEEDLLIESLNKAADYSAKLENLKDQLRDKENRASTESQRQQWADYQKEIVKVTGELNELKDKIINLLKVQRLSTSSNEVLKAVDFLLYYLGEASSLHRHIVAMDTIALVDKEAKERDLALGVKINDLENEFSAFKTDVAKFKNQVNARFKGLDDQISSLHGRADLINQMLNHHMAASAAADEALRLALSDLKSFTELQIVELTNKNAQLKEDILKQKNILEELFSAESEVASLAGRLCSVNSQGQISDSRQQCTGAEPNLYTGASCCLTIDAVDCSTMFPSEVQISARNQCNVLVSTVKNHDEQLRAIREVDQKQTELIAGLLDDVTNISDQLSILAKGYELLNNAVNAIAGKLSDLDTRLMIVEFKAARSEAAAGLNERADLNLAWIARRTTDVTQRFCQTNVNNALNQFDYEAARQNWHYCQEKLEFLTRAKELTQLAKAYTNGLLSVNVDSACAAQINGKSAEQLTNSELLDENIFREVQSKCTTGGAVVARAAMLNVVQLLSVVGPDFRTVAYMNKKAKIVQMLFFGKPVMETSTAERAAFELVDPTAPAIADTLYARIERPFVKRYVEHRMRTLAGAFPEKASDIPESIAGFNTIHSESAIRNGNTDFFRRLAALELKGECSSCGFMVDRRTTTDVVISKGGKERFSYPKDAESLCPIQNDHVVLKSNKDGKYYAYVLNYDWIYERLTPYLRNGVHVPIANSDADMNSGNFYTCGRHADYLVNRNGLGVAQLQSRLMLTLTTPYGNTYAGRGQCLKSTFVCVMRNQEWVAPSGSSDLLSYLNNYSNSVVTNQCKYNMGSLSKVRTRNLTSAEKGRIRTFSGTVDQASLNLRAKVSNTTTQLTSNYWTLRDKALVYGVSNSSVSQSNPFFGSAQSHTDSFVRAHHALTSDVPVQECTPNE